MKIFSMFPLLYLFLVFISFLGNLYYLDKYANRETNYLGTIISGLGVGISIGLFIFGFLFFK